MIQGIANALSNSTFVNLTQNTAARVSIETTLKSIGRPGFILIDKDIDSNTKSYAATKEFVTLANHMMALAKALPKDEIHRLQKENDVPALIKILRENVLR